MVLDVHIDSQRRESKPVTESNRILQGRMKAERKKGKYMQPTKEGSRN